MMRLTHVVAFLGMMALAAGARAGTVIGDFSADFQGGTPKAGWSYLWNANGAIGNAANYSPLLWDSSRNQYVVQVGTFPAGNPASYTTVLNNHAVHPGNAQGANNEFDRFVIAAFTVPTSGVTSIANFMVSDADQHGGDGVEFYVGVNNVASLLGQFRNGESFSQANISLGHLSAGDVIYVGIGPKGDYQYDTTNLSYQIVQTPAVPLPAAAWGGLTLLGGLLGSRRLRRKA